MRNGLIFGFLVLLVASIGLSKRATAEDTQSGDFSVAFYTRAFTHILCNEKASNYLINRDEAKYCVENFEELKIALHPDYSLETFGQLSSELSAQVSVDGYQYYRQWLDANADQYEILKSCAANLTQVAEGR